MLARPDSYPLSPPHPSLSPECVVYAASAPDSTAVCLPAESDGFPWEAGVSITNTTLPCGSSSFHYYHHHHHHHHQKQRRPRPRVPLGM